MTDSGSKVREEKLMSLLKVLLEYLENVLINLVLHNQTFKKLGESGQILVELPS
jgi:hypothetical protein